MIVLDWLRQPEIQVGVLAIAGGFYVWGAVNRWRRGTWRHRALYMVAGILFGVYEVHMMWWWLVGGGVALILATQDLWGTESLQAARGNPGRRGMN